MRAKALDTPVSFRCSECNFELWTPVAALNVSTLGLYSDKRFPGRSILVLNEHWDHLDGVDDELAFLFFADMKRSGAAIKQVTSANRINYAVLGNEVSHVHAHLIPRYPANEPLPHRTPWEQGAEHIEMAISERKRWAGRLASALEGLEPAT